MLTVVCPVARGFDLLLENLKKVNADEVIIGVDNKKLEIPRIDNATIIGSGRTPPLNFDQRTRRKRIADMHNRMGDWVTGDLVLCLEDDTVLPDKFDLVDKYEEGILSGVQLSRHGIPVIGAWVFDDLESPTSYETVTWGTERVHAAGLYCCVLSAVNYRNHTFEHHPFPPDISLGRQMSLDGFPVRLDWGTITGHRTKDGDLYPDPKTLQVEKVIRQGKVWRRGV